MYEPIATSGLKIWSKTNPKLIFVWSGKDWDEITKVIQLLKFFDIEMVEGEEEELDEETKETVKEIVEDSQNVSL